MSSFLTVRRLPLLFILLSMFFTGMQAKATQVNFLTNGGFEEGTTSGWSITNGSPYYVFQSNSIETAQAGNYWFAAQWETTTLSQTFKDVAGTALSFSGWHSDFINVNSGNSCCSTVSILFNGTTVASVTENSLISWEQLTANMTATGSDTLTISVYGGAWTSGQPYPEFGTALDSFSVLGTAPSTSTSKPTGVPGPNTAFMLALAFLAGIGLRAKIKNLT